jgi:hypothetical protein
MQQMQPIQSTFRYILEPNSLGILIGTPNENYVVYISLDKAHYLLKLGKELYDNYLRNVFSDDFYIAFSGVGHLFSHLIHTYTCKNPYHESIGEEKECIEEICNILVTSTNELEQMIISRFRENLRFLFVEKALVDFLLCFYQLCETMNMSSS